MATDRVSTPSGRRQFSTRKLFGSVYRLGTMARQPKVKMKPKRSQSKLDAAVQVKERIAARVVLAAVPVRGHYALQVDGHGEQQAAEGEDADEGGELVVEVQDGAVPDEGHCQAQRDQVEPPAIVTVLRTVGGGGGGWTVVHRTRDDKHRKE
ncbi:hypothetical protein TYRP_022021 [Tyrophagus putrescentiae]|nr:hypothetical protein TYRP_022021 [Tyrophagus putrescentiae]